MFFRREKPKEPTFAERLENLRRTGFSVEMHGPARALVSKNGCAAWIEDAPKRPKVEKAGWLIGGEIGVLVDAGYQKFWRTPSGRTEPALASQLRALHDFEEDLREALGLVSLYNESLGTVNDLHLYDRVLGRDRGALPRPWER